MIYNRNKSLDFIKEEDDLKKTRVSKTAQVNLMMLADLGIEEAVHFQEVFGFSRGVLDVFSHVPMASQLPQCISLISEVLYRRTNEICEALEKKGFLVERVPLYTDTLEMKSLDRISPQKAQKVISNWQNTDSLIVTIK